MMTTYEQLIQSAHGGDEHAIETLLDKLAKDKTYHNMALRILKHPEDTEDVIQDALILAFKRWRQFQGKSRFATWYGRIVINCALMKLRSNGKTKMDTVLVDKIDEQMHLDDYVETTERSAALMEAIQVLPEGLAKTCISLHVGKDLTIREVATRLDIPYSSAKSAIQRTRRKLKKRLTKTLLGHPNFSKPF
jgi:RNA polymerase sigma-70 factor, ECF subfamily